MDHGNQAKSSIRRAASEAITRAAFEACKREIVDGDPEFSGKAWKAADVASYVAQQGITLSAGEARKVAGLLRILREREAAKAPPVGVAYRVPGKGGWRQKDFATKALAERFVDRLVEREGSDVEVRWSFGVAS